MLNLLNRIFTVENSAVFAEDGSLEKPVGDQFLAYWGAPNPQPDAADRALRAALMLIEELQKLNETFDPQTGQLFGYGLALHAGQSLIANIGSAQFFHYGVIGDVINATARVESLTKYYGVIFLATHDVCKRLTRAPLSRMIDRVIVKGNTHHSNCSSYVTNSVRRILTRSRRRTQRRSFYIKKANFVMRNASFAHSAGSINRAASSLRDVCSLPPSHPLSGAESTL